jgi:hypothetical protein
MRALAVRCGRGCGAALAQPPQPLQFEHDELGELGAASPRRVPAAAVIRLPWRRSTHASATNAAAHSAIHAVDARGWAPKLPSW